MADKPNYWERKTLTGMTLQEVYDRIDADLGKNAYKPIPGGANLTDIKPAFVYEVLTECFGVCGDGWGYEVNDLQQLADNKFLARVTNWYVLPTELADGEVHHTRISLPESTGGSKNSETHYAAQGAITNAVGNGWSRFGMQRHIYKNEEAPLDEGAKAKAAADKEAEKQRAALESDLTALIELAKTKDGGGDMLRTGLNLGAKATMAQYRTAYAALSDTERKAVEATIAMLKEKS